MKSSSEYNKHPFQNCRQLMVLHLLEKQYRLVRKIEVTRTRKKGEGQRPGREKVKETWPQISCPSGKSISCSGIYTTVSPSSTDSLPYKQLPAAQWVTICPPPRSPLGERKSPVWVSIVHASVGATSRVSAAPRRSMLLSPPHSGCGSVQGTHRVPGFLCTPRGPKGGDLQDEHTIRCPDPPPALGDGQPEPPLPTTIPVHAPMCPSALAGLPPLMPHLSLRFRGLLHPVPVRDFVALAHLLPIYQHGF